MTLALTQDLGYLLRRSFGFAQDDRLGRQSDQLQRCKAFIARQAALAYPA
jgi:hypothetical protein